MTSASLILALALSVPQVPATGISSDSITGDNAVFPSDSLIQDLPESLGYDVDSLMELWFAKQYMSYDSDCIDGSVNPVFSDSVYAVRLANLPTIVEMPYNSIVRNSIDAYMVRNRKAVSFALGMLPMYEEIFVEALLRYNVPVELKYLPIVESALKPRAYSRAGAAGMCQFIYSTGRNYGLYVNSLVDDRYDVIKETDAAAHHLKDLYDTFGDWSLAISAYNCGPGNITKAINNHHYKVKYNIC